MWHDILWCAGMFAVGSLIAVVAYMLGMDSVYKDEERKQREKFPD